MLEVEHCVVRPAANAKASKVQVVQTMALDREARLRGVVVRPVGEHGRRRREVLQSEYWRLNDARSSSAAATAGVY
jgi:hypothetical protein